MTCCAHAVLDVVRGVPNHDRLVAESVAQAEYRAKLVDGPVIRIPLEKMNISFDPNKLFPLDDRGTVYPEMRITDNWGVLEVTNGMALLSKNWDAVTVPAMNKVDGSRIQGPGYTLTLSKGYEVRAGSREGELAVGKATAH